MSTRTTAKSKSQPSRAIPGLNGRGLVQHGAESRLELRDRLQLPRAMFGRVVNVSERTIAKVEATAAGAEKLRRPYNETYRLIEALDEVVDPASLSSWFDTPNDVFGGLKPIEVIERGDIHRLWEMVFRLRSGIPA
jgi:hypothetical protein